MDISPFSQLMGRDRGREEHACPDLPKERHEGVEEGKQSQDHYN
jgi:hypothetical protein